MGDVDKKKRILHRWW